MYGIDSLKVEPVSNSVNSEIRVVSVLKSYRNSVIPIAFHGCLTDRNEHRIASLSEWQIPYKNPKVIYTESGRTEETITVYFYFQLTRKAIDFLETLRDRNPNKDLELGLRFEIVTIVSKMSDPKIYAQIENDNVLNNLLYLFQFRDGNNRPNSEKVHLISANRDGKVLEFQYDEQKRNFTISSSDWAQKYCSALGVGKYATVDLYLPESTRIEGEFEQYLDNSLKSVEQMEYYLRHGEWSDVIKESRQLAELFREKTRFDEWNKFLGASGYNDQTIGDLNGLIQNMFDFSSKFVHRTDTKKNLMVKNKVEKEDAYFIYATSIGLVNLISKKVQDFKKTQ